jgi:hypothetical protein
LLEGLCIVNGLAERDPVEDGEGFLVERIWVRGRPARVLSRHGERAGIQWQ